MASRMRCQRITWSTTCVLFHDKTWFTLSSQVNSWKFKELLSLCRITIQVTKTTDFSLFLKILSQHLRPFLEEQSWHFETLKLKYIKCMGMVGQVFLTISQLLHENDVVGSTALSPTIKWRPFILLYYTLQNYCRHHDAIIIHCWTLSCCVVCSTVGLQSDGQQKTEGGKQLKK
jgi:hypothetical protein